MKQNVEKRTGRIMKYENRIKRMFDGIELLSDQQKQTNMTIIFVL